MFFLLHVFSSGVIRIFFLPALRSSTNGCLRAKDAIIIARFTHNRQSVSPARGSLLKT
jgi:hypothetical protein